MVPNQSTFRISSSIAFEIVKSPREVNQKRMALGQFFSFSNFLKISEFWNRFYYQLEQIFLNSYQWFRSYTTSLLRF